MQVSERFDNLGADGKPVRLGLMGGTFDPIHVGHLLVAEVVREACDLDAVLFIPTGNPVFKRDQHVTDAEVRYACVRAAVEDNPHFDVSRIEIDREGDTFTVDTLRQLRAHYPDNVEITFITGSDAAQSIGKWRGVTEIARMARLAVAVGRPGTADEDTLRRDILAAAPFDLSLVRVPSLEVSSSDIRARIASGRSVRYLVAQSVLSCEAFKAEAAAVRAQADAPAENKGATGNGDGGGPRDLPDPLSDEFFAARKAELEQRVKPKRFAHSMGVSEACVQLARAYGVDVAKARLAGLLHDWDKGMDDDQARARVHELGMVDDVDPWVVRNMPRVLHGYTAARALGRDFPQIPPDVLQAIDRHTTAAVDMTPLDMVLYIADAIEPNRQFGRIDELRAHVGKATLEELYFQTYEYWTYLLFERRQPLHPDTMRIWNANALRWQKDKGAGAKGKKKHEKKRED